ncbi:DNA/RNA non-specific endonuclease [Pseudoalteromonas xiamenensis]
MLCADFAQTLHDSRPDPGICISAYLHICVIYGNNSSDDYFLHTHGITTPDAFWKIIIKNDGSHNAWLIPNSNDATKEKLATYITTISNIERISGITIPLKNVDKELKTVPWQMPKKCDLS